MSRPTTEDNQATRPALLGRTREELRSIIQGFGQPAFRGNQIAKWLYEKRARAIDEMTDLPRDLRAALAGRFEVGRPTVAHRQEAPDLTTKMLHALPDGARVETVLLPYADRASVCVSSQVGCAAGCVFCATAMMGFDRNLTAGEIVGQALSAADALAALPGRNGPARLSHVVFMGMGEPLWNIDNVLKAIGLMNTEMGIGMRGITVSTVGIPDEMRRIAEAGMPFTLAVSLHAGTEDTRRRLVPVGRKYRFDDVVDAALYYFERTGRRVTYEYVLLGGVNDTPGEARALAERLHGTHAHVNLIPWNPAYSRMAFRPPDPSHINGFRDILERSGIVTTQRLERGRGIDAACGQLIVKRDLRAP